MTAPRPLSTGRRLWRYARPMRGLLLAGTLALVLNSGVEPAMMYFLQHLLDALKLGGGSMGQINQLFWVLSLLGVLLAATDFAHTFTADYIGQTIVRDLRRDLFARMQHLSLSFYDDQSTGLLMSRATNDVNVLQTRLNYELARLIKCPLSIAALLGLMLYTSWRLTLVSFVTVAVLVPLVDRAGKLMKAHTTGLQDRLGDLSARLQESIAAIRVVQCFGATDVEIGKFEVENANVRRAAMRTVRVRSLLQPLTHLIGLLGLLVVMWFGGYELFVRRSITAGQLLVLLGSLQLITTNFKQLGRALLAQHEILAAAEKIFQVIDTASEVVDRPGAVALEEIEGRVTFAEVGFRYKTGRTVLDGVTLELSPGEAVAVVGPSGAGKSTLANLIPRLYDVTSGQVLVDGHDVRDVTLASLRAQIGIVPQETVLFRGTIRDNIAYGRPDASLDEVVAAAVAANADAFIREFPDGYETLVGERGRTLSGGQAQRVAIARAILRDPKILILDEATSSLDTQNEALVQEALERLMRARTTLVIAHRLSTIQSCHRIVVLQDGQIAESGTHQELLDLGGHYRRSYLLQQGDHAA
ncbi:MAG: ABC transporter ATP-binding protein [Armatimonadetes bacterium]|nr:ABC transporter ATP-binding protein [Armatimonadota bacterium]